MKQAPIQTSNNSDPLSLITREVVSKAEEMQLFAKKHIGLTVHSTKSNKAEDEKPLHRELHGQAHSESFHTDQASHSKQLVTNVKYRTQPKKGALHTAQQKGWKFSSLKQIQDDISLQ